MATEAPLAPESAARWRLTRRCAVTPGQLLLSYAVVVALSSTTSVLFGWHGIWVVPVFCLMVVLIAGAMYLTHMAHATDGEEITLRPDGEVTIAVVRGLKTRRYRMNAAWLRLERGGREKNRLWLCSSQLRVEVASQLRDRDRRRFEGELRRALATREAGVLQAPVAARGIVAPACY